MIVSSNKDLFIHTVPYSLISSPFCWLSMCKCRKLNCKTVKILMLFVVYWLGFKLLLLSSIMLKGHFHKLYVCLVSCLAIWILQWILNTMVKSFGQSNSLVLLHIWALSLNKTYPQIQTNMDFHVCTPLDDDIALLYEFDLFEANCRNTELFSLHFCGYFLGITACLHALVLYLIHQAATFLAHIAIQSRYIQYMHVCKNEERSVHWCF